MNCGGIYTISCIFCIILHDLHLIFELFLPVKLVISINVCILYTFVESSISFALNFTLSQRFQCINSVLH